MCWSFKRWQRRRVLRNSKIEDSIWISVVERCHFLQGFSSSELERLRSWTVLFLHQKRIYGAKGLEIDDQMRVFIAVQACLLILNLDLDFYRGWNEIIVYPHGFIPKHEYTDEAGVVHISNEVLAGESWLQGPIILSWDDIKEDGLNDGANTIIHEFAHKIDMLNGSANGFPPLHKGMSRAIWAKVFSVAYNDFRNDISSNNGAEIDTYAAQDPAEFFAVLSETFFETPRAVFNRFPGVYDQLKQFYRQDPMARPARK